MVLGVIWIVKLLMKNIWKLSVYIYNYSYIYKKRNKITDLIKIYLKLFFLILNCTIKLFY